MYCSLFFAQKQGNVGLSGFLLTFIPKNKNKEKEPSHE